MVVLCVVKSREEMVLDSLMIERYAVYQWKEKGNNMANKTRKKTKGIMAVVFFGEHQGITLKLKLKENGRRNELLSNASVLEVAWHKLR